MRQAEAFLKKRGWKVRSAILFKDAIAMMLQDPPEFLLLCVENAHPKIRVLPKALAQTLRCAVIPFADTATPFAIRTMNELSPEYSIFPPISGPSVERMVSRILKKVDEVSANLKNGGSYPFELERGSDLFLNFSQRSQDSEGTIAVSGAEDALKKLLSEDDAKVALATNGVMFQKGVHGRSEAMVAPGDRKSASSPAVQAEGAQHYLSKFARDELQMEPATEATKKATDFFRPPERAAGSYESILFRGTSDALDKTVIKGTSKTKPAAIGQATNAACLIVKSKRFSGYLVVVLGKDQKIDPILVEDLRARLFKFLEEGGEVIRAEEQIQLKLEQVEFHSWALEHAEFLRKSVHLENEIAMAFFPHKEVDTKFSESASEKMLSLEINEIRGDVKMEFDVFVYMPANNKYLLYTPKGGTFYEHQKDRLIAKGISKMHLKKESVSDVKRYRAQNYLNDKISEYSQRRRFKKLG